MAWRWKTFLALQLATASVVGEITGNALLLRRRSSHSIAVEQDPEVTVLDGPPSEQQLVTNDAAAQLMANAGFSEEEALQSELAAAHMNQAAAQEHLAAAREFKHASAVKRAAAASEHHTKEMERQAAAAARGTRDMLDGLPEALRAAYEAGVHDVKAEHGLIL